MRSPLRSLFSVAVQDNLDNVKTQLLILDTHADMLSIINRVTEVKKCITFKTYVLSKEHKLRLSFSFSFPFPEKISDSLQTPLR